jgi:glycosyltransferase involved in cell wall biosynthesis
VNTVPIKLAAFVAGPVYNQAPLYRRLATDPRIEFTAIFASSAGVRPYDAGYGKPITWDVDTLDGYQSKFLRRADRYAKSSGFFALRDPDIVTELVHGGYDVLWMHGYNYLTHQLAAVTQFLRRRPLLVRENQTLLHSRPLWKQTIKEVSLRAMLWRAYGLYVGSQNRRWFQHFGVPDERLFFTPYCVDNERFQRDAVDLASKRCAIKRELGIHDDSGPVILTVCRLIPKKQPHHLLEAFRRVRAEQQCTLLIVGAGELEGEIRQCVKDQNIPDVILAGFLNQSQVSRGYASADLFVLASARDETWGNVVNEAMNFGLPLVLSDKVGCAEDLVQPGKNGFIVPSDDVQSLADRLGVLVYDSNLRACFGARSREIIDAWNCDVAVRGIIEAVEAAVGPERWAQANG